VNQSWVVFIVVWITFDFKGPAPTPCLPLAPYPHLVVFIHVIITLSYGAWLSILEFVVFELHFIIPLQIEVSIGRPRTLPRTVVARFYLFVFLDLARLRTFSNLPKSIMTHFTLLACSPLITSGIIIDIYSFLSAIISLYVRVCIGVCFIISEKRTRLLPPLSCRVLQFTDFLDFTRLLFLCLCARHLAHHFISIHGRRLLVYRVRRLIIGQVMRQ